MGCFWQQSAGVMEWWSIGKYQIPILNDQNRFGILKLGTRPQGGESKRSADNFGHCYLPFDLAQGGELVEPFDI